MHARHLGSVRRLHPPDSRSTCDAWHDHESLTLGMEVLANLRLVATRTGLSGPYGLPGPARMKPPRTCVTAGDPTNRKFQRGGPKDT